jgi:lipoprotein-releasing system permease protein
MIRPLELFVGLRYVRARRRDHFISFISLVSIIGIALGVMTVIVVMSVMNGFGTELRSRILGVVSHVTVTGKTHERLGDWQSAAKAVKQDPRVLATAPFVLGQAMATRGREMNGVEVRGVLPDQERTVSSIGDKMVEGSLEALKPGEFGVVVGSGLAWKLDLHVGSPVSLVIPQATATPAGLLPRFKRFTVVGVFRTDHNVYDNALVLTHLDDTARLYQFGDNVSGLRLKVNDLDAAPAIAAQLQGRLGEGYVARDWTYANPNFFSALKLEKRVMFFLLLLVVTVAMFNLVSTLVVMVTEKQADIAVLRTLGLSPRSIMAVFIIVGALIGGVGTFLGTAFGFLIAYYLEPGMALLEGLLNTKFIPGDVYLISILPSDVHLRDLVIIAVSSFVLALLATIYPAWRAAKAPPAAALRYE